MKITSVEVYVKQYANFPISKSVFCVINTDEGICGYGEAGVSFISGSYATAEMIKDYAKLIIGMDPLENSVIWNKLFTKTYWTQGNGAIVISAISAIDIAVWDIKGKALNVPVYKLLGGKHRDSVRCYASQLQFGWDCLKPAKELEAYRRNAEIAVERGYDAVKVDPLQFADKQAGHLVDGQNYGDLDPHVRKVIDDRLRVTRETVGPDADIILELHCSTTYDTALEICRIAEQYDIMYAEEALNTLNPALTKELSQNTKIPLANGERTYLREGFLPFLRDRSLALIQPDLGICGGITEGMRIADLAAIYHVGVQAHVCGTPISTAAGLHFEAAIPNFTIHETHIAALYEPFVEMADCGFIPENGRLSIPEKPGLGITLTDKAFENAEKSVVK
ncbi:MAG: mandelate racemase/muconate lactonizing enzyme family protein [Oscillospiraceae bacterium]|nr:mandelate racemase/muconate lactonizing enzyme family protein [Oscillospiraceae bacterium]